jgi:hypothetical protein
MSDESSKPNPSDPPSSHGKPPEEAKHGMSYSDALALAKAQIYSEALERGEYVSESTIEEQVKERAAEIMRDLDRGSSRAR